MDELLKILQSNALESREDIARMLGLPADEVNTRIADYEKRGVIRGYQAILNEDQLDLDKVTAVIGSAPKRYVVIAFDSLERARRWSDSAPAKELDAIRSRAAKSRTFIVEGLAH